MSKRKKGGNIFDESFDESVHSLEDTDGEYVPEGKQKREPKIQKKSASAAVEKEKRSKAAKNPGKVTPKRARKVNKGKDSIVTDLPKVSSDTRVVLRAVKELRNQHKTVAHDDELALAVKGQVQVSDMVEDEVMDKIESVVKDVVNSIVRKQGFEFSVAERSSKNTEYIAELDRIVLGRLTTERSFGHLNEVGKVAITVRVLQLIYELCGKQIHATKRDLFYTDVKLFEKQKSSDDVLEDIATIIGCTRPSLNVLAAEKGIIIGRVTFRDSGDFIDCTKMGVGGKAIPGSVDRITDIKSDATFILVVEKDAAFMRLAEDRFYRKYPCIIMTAKGQPDVATRLLLHRLKVELGIPVLAMVDADPYGLKILSVYASGSKNMSYDAAHLTTPDIKWLGIRPSDFDKYKIPEQCLLPMSDKDIEVGKNLLNEDFIKEKAEWYKELQLMMAKKQKAEIQALSTFGFQYLTEVYLPLKLQQGDFF